MRLHLPPYRHAALVGDDLVVLDVHADRYLALPAVGAGLGLSPDGGSATLLEPTLRGPLEAIGFDAAAPGPRTRVVPPPAADAAEDLRHGAPPRLPPAALARAAAAWAQFQGASFRGLLDAGPGPAALEVPPDLRRRALRLAWAFGGAWPWAPGASKCLLRGFVLRRLLYAAGVRPCWVFGVQTWPFAAHCWLQLGPTVLDDRPERVLPFTPILVA